MKRRYIGLALGILVAMGAALSLPSCMHERQLVSIAVTPATVTYLSPNAVPAAFQAMGTYIHPPETKNITQLVTWATDVPDMLTLSPVTIVDGEPVEEVAPNGVVCGIANLSATASEGTNGAANIVVGYATLTVDGTQPNCPGAD